MTCGSISKNCAAAFFPSMLRHPLCIAWDALPVASQPVMILPRGGRSQINYIDWSSARPPRPFDAYPSALPPPRHTRFTTRLAPTAEGTPPIRAQQISSVSALFIVNFPAPPAVWYVGRASRHRRESARQHGGNTSASPSCTAPSFYLSSLEEEMELESHENKILAEFRQELYTYQDT